MSVIPGMTGGVLVIMYIMSNISDLDSDSHIFVICAPENY